MGTGYVHKGAGTTLIKNSGLAQHSGESHPEGTLWDAGGLSLKVCDWEGVSSGAWEDVGT